MDSKSEKKNPVSAARVLNGPGPGRCYRELEYGKQLGKQSAVTVPTETKQK